MVAENGNHRNVRRVSTEPDIPHQHIMSVREGRVVFVAAAVLESLDNPGTSQDYGCGDALTLTLAARERGQTKAKWSISICMVLRVGAIAASA